MSCLALAASSSPKTAPRARFPALRATSLVDPWNGRPPRQKLELRRIHNRITPIVKGKLVMVALTASVGREGLSWSGGSALSSRNRASRLGGGLWLWWSIAGCTGHPGRSCGGSLGAQGGSVTSSSRSPLREKLTKSRRQMVILLDNAEVLLRKEGPELIYDFLRVNDEAGHARGTISVVMVSVFEPWEFMHVVTESMFGWKNSIK